MHGKPVLQRSRHWPGDYPEDRENSSELAAALVCFSLLFTHRLQYHSLLDYCSHLNTDIGYIVLLRFYLSSKSYLLLASSTADKRIACHADHTRLIKATQPTREQCCLHPIASQRQASQPESDARHGMLVKLEYNGIAQYSNFFFRCSIALTQYSIMQMPAI